MELIFSFTATEERKFPIDILIGLVDSPGPKSPLYHPILSIMDWSIRWSLEKKEKEKEKIIHFKHEEH